MQFSLKQNYFLLNTMFQTPVVFEEFIYVTDIFSENSIK